MGAIQNSKTDALILRPFFKTKKEKNNGRKPNYINK